MFALWRTGLLLGLLRCSVTLGEECVLGVIGQPIILPCMYDGDLELGALNFSIEWRREDDVIYRSVWGEGNQDTWRVSSRNTTRVSDKADSTRDFSLELAMVVPFDSNTYTMHLVVTGGNHSMEVCSVCLKTAASFSHPLMERRDPEEGAETQFTCHSRGGFPQPEVVWDINGTGRPPKEFFTTSITPLPDSQLLNVTSVLTANVSQDVSVSCTIRNPSMNESFTATSYGMQDSPVVGRAAEAMWMFSTGLSVVVGVLVLAALFYQIHLDRTYKKRSRAMMEEMETCEEDQETTAMMKVERVVLTETNV